MSVEIFVLKSLDRMVARLTHWKSFYQLSNVHIIDSEIYVVKVYGPAGKLLQPIVQLPVLFLFEGGVRSSDDLAGASELQSDRIRSRYTLGKRNVRVSNIEFLNLLDQLLTTFSRARGF